MRCRKSVIHMRERARERERERERERALEPWRGEIEINYLIVLIIVRYYI